MPLVGVIDYDDWSLNREQFLGNGVPTLGWDRAGDKGWNLTRELLDMWFSAADIPAFCRGYNFSYLFAISVIYLSAAFPYHPTKERSFPLWGSPVILSNKSVSLKNLQKFAGPRSFLSWSRQPNCAPAVPTNPSQRPSAQGLQNPHYLPTPSRRFLDSWTAASPVSQSSTTRCNFTQMHPTPVGAAAWSTAIKLGQRPVVTGTITNDDCPFPPRKRSPCCAYRRVSTTNASTLVWMSWQTAKSSSQVGKDKCLSAQTLPPLSRTFSSFASPEM